MLAYIAAENPTGAQRILSNYGYDLVDVHTTEDLAIVLEQFIEREGEPGLYDLTKIHPDRDLILEAETISKPEKTNGNGNNGNTEAPGCGCKWCAKEKIAEMTGSNKLGELFASPSTLMIISGTILLTAAILLKN